jgi:hypothetical protein
MIRLAGVAQIVLIQRNKAPREAQSGLTLSGGGIERRDTRKSRQGFPRRPAVALRLRRGVLRRAVLER